MQAPTPESPASKRKTRPGSSIPLLRDKAPTTPYKLREGSKLPSRYRDEEPLPVIKLRSPNKKSPQKISNVVARASPARRALGKVDAVPGSSNSITASEPRKFPFPSSSTYRDPAFLNQSGSNNEIGSTSNEVDSFSSPGGPDKRLSLSRPGAETDVGRIGLLRLQHLLSLSKARRWTICEFFYSAVDEQLFLADNEFQQVLQESFPNLKTMMLNKQQWRTIRRLLGKPRRCSPQFFNEERASLESKRSKIRSIYEATFFSNPNADYSDLPLKLPRPLVVGMRVYARIHSPKDGIYGGTIDAVLKNGYRVIFEKEDLIPPLEVPDSQVMLDGRLELVQLNYFIEQCTAKMSFSAGRLSFPPISNPDRRQDIVALAHSKMQRKPTLPGSDKVGNFPVRMLVILVKLSKLIELKKKYIRQLCELNNEAERANLLTDVYHPTFQEKYAQVVIDLESINKQISMYLQGIQEYNTQLIPQLSEVNLANRPDSLRRITTTHAQQIVKHCNQGLNVQNARAISLITSLTSLLLQIRTLGQQKLTPLDMQTLAESIKEIRGMVSPKNAAWFQDHVEVHMKQIHNMMLQCGALSSR
ncbi:unnamed protein product [Auanema sp. JU1783]|nr:unnamed protein product [Auanema sp. JU1783]